MTAVAVIAHAGKTFGGGLPELRRVLATEGVSDPLWCEVPKSKKAPREVEPEPAPVAQLDLDIEDVGLTPREGEIIGLIVSGLSNREISESLQLSINSVKTYIRSAYRKMGVERRTQAVLWGLDNGLDNRVASLVS